MLQVQSEEVQLEWGHVEAASTLQQFVMQWKVSVVLVKFLNF